jgi:methionyl-tRNA formyltransferase
VGRGRNVKLAFLGTPEFAVPSLIRLHDSGHDVRLVVTQPDRPAGRGRQIQDGPVKREALARGLPLFQPERLDGPSVGKISAVGVDVLVVVAYGLILPSSLLRLPPRGCINLHASFLPRYRGAAPVAHAILNGETRTGVTTLLMDEGIDTGPILLQSASPLGPGETTGEVEKRLSEMGAEMLVRTLDELETGRIEPRAQELDRGTYAPKIRPEMARISWQREAHSITNLVRAMNPRPGATTGLGRQIVKIWRVVPGPARSGKDADASPGTVLTGEHAPRVACSEQGSVLLLEIQMEGRRRVTGEDALRGRLLNPGDRLEEAKESGGSGTGPSSPGL